MIYRNEDVELRASTEKKRLELIAKNGEMILPVASGILTPDERTKTFLCRLEHTSYVMYVLNEFNDYCKKLGFDDIPDNEVVKENIDALFKVFDAGFSCGYAYQSDNVFRSVTSDSAVRSAEETIAAMMAFIQKEDAEERERNKDFYASFGEQEENVHMIYRDAMRRGVNQVNIIASEYMDTSPVKAVGVDGKISDI